MSEQQQFTRKFLALDNAQLVLQAKSPVDENRQARLLWTIKNNQPAIYVYTGEQGQKGSIKWRLSPFIFERLMKNIEDAGKATSEVKYRIEVSDFIFPGGKRSEKPVSLGEILVKREANGVVWICLSSSSAAKVKFEFGYGATRFRVSNSAGEYQSTENSSALAAQDYADYMRRIMPIVSEKEYVHPEKKQYNGQGNNNGGGGYGNRGGGDSGRSYGNNGNSGGNTGGNSGGSFSGSDDDIPF